MPKNKMTYALLIGLFICIVGSIIVISSLGIAVENYLKYEKTSNQQNDNERKFERIMLDTVGQILVFTGFLVIYSYVILDHIKTGDW
jgi:hypothetical protein